uniref:t-SNARE coiled-coil homology domain-containing protein n=1 Tax=viral metagenome TaxID=1070528 RepID=A0A6C0EJ99_9ZZZZ
MDNVKEEILKELEELNNQSLINSHILYNQSNTIETINNSLVSVEKEVKISKWYLNLINATFGKVYKTFHNPIIVDKYRNTKDSLCLYFGKGLGGKGLDSGGPNNQRLDSGGLEGSKGQINDTIYSKIREIKDINKTVSKELDNHINKLDELDLTLTHCQFGISNNITKIEKML